MQCPDCGGVLDEQALANALCPQCLEPLVGILTELRKNLGVEEERPPELDMPSLEAAPVELPDYEDCPSCEAPLMGDDLEIWQHGAPCPYCQGVSPYFISEVTSNRSSEAPHDTAKTVSATTSDVSMGSAAFILNAPPAPTQDVILPCTVVGRSHFTALPGAQSIEQRLAKVSREHIELTLDGDVVEIMDLGSVNGTNVNGDPLTGLARWKLSTPCVIELGGLLLSYREHDSVLVEHLQSGAKVAYPRGAPIHLGRLTEEGRKEPWYRMASLLMERDPSKDPSQLETISRRHLTLSFNEDQPTMTLEEGKPAWDILPENGLSQHRFRFGSNEFVIHLV
jgi:pSer/pThr/pTyr-binding forkhead associated (FHA) protein